MDVHMEQFLMSCYKQWCNLRTDELRVYTQERAETSSARYVALAFTSKREINLDVRRHLCYFHMTCSYHSAQVV